MPRRAYSREERKEQVILVLSIRASKGLEPEGTAYTIAKLLDMTVQQRLYVILSEMVAEGRLTTRDERTPAGFERTFYRLPDGSYERPATQHQLVLNFNGKREVHSL